VTRRPDCSGPSRREVRTDVWKYLQTIVIGLYAVCKEKLDNRHRAHRPNRAVFTGKKLRREAGKVTCQDRHSTFNNGVRNAIRRGAAENEVQKRLTGAWRQMSTLRRRYERWCKGDDIEDCTHKQRYEASYQSMVKVLQQNTWIDDRKFLKSCVRARAEQDNINHPAYGLDGKLHVTAK